MYFLIKNKQSMLLLRKPCQARNQSPKFLHALPISDENKASSNGDSNADYFFPSYDRGLAASENCAIYLNRKKKRNSATSQSLYDIEALTATRAPNVGSLLFFSSRDTKIVIYLSFSLERRFFFFESAGRVSNPARRI